MHITLFNLCEYIERRKRIHPIENLISKSAEKKIDGYTLFSRIHSHLKYARTSLK